MKMTRTDGKDCSESEVEKDQHIESPPLGQVLQTAVGQALEQGRLICGLQQCAHLLQIDPFNVMMCVLPNTPESSASASSDVSTQIHHVLIEAFCREYDIRLIKVDCLVKLAKIINGHDEVDNNGLPLKRSVSVTDVSCLLMQYPQHNPSEEDETLAEFYKSSLFSDDPNTGVITLPD